MTEIKGIPPSLADKAKDSAKNRNVDDKRGETRDNGPKANPQGKGQDLDDGKNRDGQDKVRLARPDEEAQIKRDRRKGDWRNMARDDNDIDRCMTAKDRETHTRLARPDEEDDIKAKHAKDRAEAAGQTVKPKSAKELEADANEAAASVARRQALGGV